jgi:hypothetical protein
VAGLRRNLQCVMDEVVSRVIKALILGVVTFFSIFSLTGSVKLAAAVAVIPILLGSLAVFAEIGFAVATLSLCVSVVILITGTEWVDSGRRLVEQFFSDVKSVDPKAKAPEGGK